jgi:hypothetical protein
MLKYGGGINMISHFQFQSIYENQQLPGWSFSFYFQKQKFTGIYHPNGTIEWTSAVPQKENESSLKGQIHELMLFHVYEK